MFNKLQGCKQPSKILNIASFFGNIIFSRLTEKDSTQIKRICVKTFDVRHDDKHYYNRASQGITGPMKMQFFSIISFLNDSKFYEPFTMQCIL